MERMNRRWNSYSMDEVKEITKNASPETYLDYWPITESLFQYTDSLVGKKLSFVFKDGLKLDYSFIKKHNLYWSENGSDMREAFYRAMPGPGHDEIVYVTNYRDGINPPTNVDLVIDFETNLVTAIIGKVGVPENPREVYHSIHFGQISGKEVSLQAFKHEYTTELVGKSILWEMPFFKDHPPVKHIYCSQLYYTYVLRRGRNYFMATNPADYIKVKEHLYLVSVVEERQTGCQLNFFINTDTLRDIVTLFGINGGQLNSAGKMECAMLANRPGTFQTLDTILV